MDLDFIHRKSRNRSLFRSLSIIVLALSTLRAPSVGAELIAQFDFDTAPTLREETSQWSIGQENTCQFIQGTGLKCTCTAGGTRTVFSGFTKPTKVISEKTFVAEVTFQTWHRNGSVITMQTDTSDNGNTYDGFVMGGRKSQFWEAGSENAERSLGFDSPWAKESTLGKRTKVMLRLIKGPGGNGIRSQLWRDGFVREQRVKAGVPLKSFIGNDVALQFGRRNSNNTLHECLDVTIHKVSVYDDATSFWAAGGPKLSKAKDALPTNTTHVFAVEGGRAIRTFAKHVAAGSCLNNYSKGWLATPDTAAEMALLTKTSIPHYILGADQEKVKIGPVDWWYWRWTDGPYATEDGGKGRIWYSTNAQTKQRRCLMTDDVCHWDPGQPQMNAENRALNVGYHKWHDWPDFKALPTICQFPREERRYFMLKHSVSRNLYGNAYDACREQGARLPHIFSKADEERLDREIGKSIRPESGQRLFYVAVMRDVNTNEYHWPDPDPYGQTLMSVGGDCTTTKTGWCNWLGGEPHQTDDEEVMSVMGFKNGVLEGLRDTQPFEANTIICELVPTPDTPTPELTSTHESTPTRSLTSTMTTSNPITLTSTRLPTATAPFTQSAEFTKTNESTSTVTWSLVNTKSDTISPPPTASDSKSSTATITTMPTLSAEATKTTSLIVPRITVTHPKLVSYKGANTLPLSERGLTKAAAGGFSSQYIELSVEGSQWQCSAITTRRHKIFTVTPAEGSGVEDLGASAATGAAQGSVFFQRLGGLLRGRASTMCIPGTGEKVIRIHFTRDKDFQTLQDENISIAFDPALDPATTEYITSSTGNGSSGLRIVSPGPGSHGWLTDHSRISLKAMPKFHAKFTLINDRPSSPITLPKAVLESAQTTAAVGSVVSSAAGNPAMAVQGARTGLILNLVVCEDTTGEDIGFMEHPTGLAVGEGITQFWAGACLWNPIVILGTSLFHFGLVVIFKLFKKCSLDRAAATLYYPALQAMVVMPLAQPTAGAVTTIFKQSSDIRQLWAAVFGMVSLLGLWVFVVYKTSGKLGFLAFFKKFPKTGHGSRHWFYVFIAGPGTYVDKPKKRRRGIVGNPDSSGDESDGSESGGESTVDKKGDTAADSGTVTDKGKKSKVPVPEIKTIWAQRYFLFFDLYRPPRVWFGSWELLLTYVFGIVEGWRPHVLSDCKTMSIITTIMFLLTFAALVRLRPYVSRFEEIVLTYFIVGGQLVSSCCVTIFLIVGDHPAMDAGSWTAAGGMYLLAVKSLIDLFILAYDLIYDTCCSEEEEEDADKKGDDPSDLEATNGGVSPLLDATRPDRAGLSGRDNYSPRAVVGRDLSQGLLQVYSAQPQGQRIPLGVSSNPLLRPLGQGGKSNPLTTLPPPPPPKGVPPPQGDIPPPPPPPKPEAASIIKQDPSYVPPPPPPLPPPPPPLPSQKKASQRTRGSHNDVVGYQPQLQFCDI